MGSRDTPSFAESGQICITRNKGGRDRRQPYVVLIDGERVGSVDSGERVCFTVPIGERDVSIALDGTVESVVFRGGSASPTRTVTVPAAKTIALTANSRGSWSASLDLIHSFLISPRWVDLELSSAGTN